MIIETMADEKLVIGSVMDTSFYCFNVLNGCNTLASKFSIILRNVHDNFVCDIYGYAFKSLHLKNSKLLALNIFTIRLNFQKYIQFGLSCKTYKKIFLRPF